MRKRGQYFCFRTGFLGNDFKTTVVYNGLEFNNTWHLYSFILAESSGNTALMREVIGCCTLQAFGEIKKKVEDWVSDEKRLEDMRKSISLKFNSNPVVRNFLIDSKYDGLTFVYTDKYDDFWGIKQDECAKGIQDPRNWKGENRLGQIITDYRTCILSTLTSFSLP